MDISKSAVDYQVEDHSWVGSSHGFDATESITLDISAFTANTHYPNGYIPSGVALAKLSNGLWGPYLGVTEVQLLTVATSGNTTITFDGESTAALTLTATNAVAGDVTIVQNALNGLSNVDPGDLVVSLGSGGTAGKLIITAAGRYAGKDIPQLTATGTGAGVTTSTAGGETGIAASPDYGHLATATKVPNTANTAIDAGAALFVHGKVREANLPSGHGVDAGFKARVAGRIRYI